MNAILRFLFGVALFGMVAAGFALCLDTHIVDVCVAMLICAWATPYTSPESSPPPDVHKEPPG